MNSPAPNPETKGTFVTDAALKRLKKRHAAETRFKFYGQFAIAIAVLALIALLVSIISQASSAFQRNMLVFDITLNAEDVAPNGTDDPDAIARNVSGFNLLLQDSLRDQFLTEDADASETRQLFGLFTRLAVLPVAKKTAAHVDMVGTQQTVSVALADDIDLYLKGGVTERKSIDLGQVASARGAIGDGIYVSLAPGTDTSALAEAIGGFQEQSLDDSAPTTLIGIGNTWYSVTGFSSNEIALAYLAGARVAPDPSQGIRALVLAQAEANRTVSDRQIAWTMLLKDEGRIRKAFNSTLFTNADSTYPELAGTAAAIVGSLLTMLVTALLAIPVGIFAAVYLEEFAPKNRMTDLIEVNINNLAAVPSIVFGLLGAAVFINFFGMPRSVPLVGGLVLGLLVLPTVIIASRAALKSVPPSIRTAALGVGASKTQSVFHHVLPLAAPGILTGSIIGMARALGETAPLLLIGMVAFVAEVPDGPTDESTVLPVLIYKWSTGAERAWEPQTAAAIIVLLVFLVLMNLIAIILRRRFERRW